jgi:hypothetical protein
MKHIALALLGVVLISHASLADEEQASPQVRALSQRISAEITANLDCNIAVQTLKDQLAAANAAIKKWKEYSEPLYETPAAPTLPPKPETSREPIVSPPPDSSH